MVVLQQAKADMFSANVQTLVNPVNCVGVMGGGLAAIFKTKFPKASKQYFAACDTHNVQPGSILVCAEDDPIIVHLATKNHWKDPSQLVWVESGTHSLKTWAETNHIKTIACPALGAGLGGLRWSDVANVIHSVFDDSPVSLLLYPPH